MMDIMNMLLSKRKLTASQIAERYGISERSVYRYVEELNVCGVPVDVVRGRYGGLRIADSYKLPMGYFTRGEYEATVNAITAMSSQVNDENLSSALNKLTSQQKKEKRELSVCGNIIVDGGSWGANKLNEMMRICEEAVNNSICLYIDYISRSGEHSKRVIEPHVLVLKKNVWYVYAFCHTKQSFRTFKIGRIKNASFTEPFTKRSFTRDEIDLNFYDTQKSLIDVTLEIAPSSLADAEEWLGIDNIEPQGDALVANLSLPDDDGLVNKILSYGGAVKVLEPKSLGERVAAAARRIADGAL